MDVVWIDHTGTVVYPEAIIIEDDVGNTYLLDDENVPGVMVLKRAEV